VNSSRTRFAWWPYALLALVATLGPALFWEGGTLERETTLFIPQYTADRPLLAKIFDPYANDFGTYQARELSYFVDYLDAQVYTRVVAPIDATFFIPASAFLVPLLFLLVFARGVRRTAAHLDALTGALILACFVSSFVFVSTMGVFYRSGKPLVALAILAFLFHVRGVHQARQSSQSTQPTQPTQPELSAPHPPRRLRRRILTRDGAIAFALAMFAGLLDRQGVFYVLIGCGVLFVHDGRMRRMPDLLMATCAAAAALHVYNVFLAPAVVHQLNGYWPSFQYQKVPLKHFPLRIVPALRMLAEESCVMLGGSWWLTLACLAVAGIVVLRARRRAPGSSAPGDAIARQHAGRTLLYAGLVLIGHVVMFALMIARHPFIYEWIDHRYWYYPLPCLAVLLFALVVAWDAVLPRLGRGDRRVMQLVLAALVLGNVLSLPRDRDLMLGGPWFSQAHLQSERLQESLRSGTMDESLEPTYQTFFSYAEAAREGKAWTPRK